MTRVLLSLVKYPYEMILNCADGFLFQSRDAAVAETERIVREDVSSLQERIAMLEGQVKKANAQCLLEAEKVCSWSDKREFIMFYKGFESCFNFEICVFFHMTSKSR
jgi:hypothetical protein